MQLLDLGFNLGVGAPPGPKEDRLRSNTTGHGMPLAGKTWANGTSPQLPFLGLTPCLHQSQGLPVFAPFHTGKRSYLALFQSQYIHGPCILWLPFPIKISSG